MPAAQVGPKCILKRTAPLRRGPPGIDQIVLSLEKLIVAESGNTP